MKYWIAGKLTGAAVGWVVAGPVGGLVGLAVGHALDHFTEPEEGEAPADAKEGPRFDFVDQYQTTAVPRDAEAMARLGFASHLVALFASVARADGPIRREEVRAIRAFFENNMNLTGGDLGFVKRLLKESLSSPVDVGAAAKFYHAHSTAAERLLFVQSLYEMATSRGDPDPAEQKVIARIVVALDITEADHHAIRALFIAAPGLGEDYATLGVPPGIDDGELKKAFRVLAARHHPDKVTHLGPDAVAMAGKRFAELKDAYERIRAARGL